jgi:hypothetical protein
MCGMGNEGSPEMSVKHRVVEGLRVLTVAGIPTGMLVAGVGSRLAMLLLRVTSDDSVKGLESDDGFTIGEFTMSGTYNLLLLGAVVGVIGAGAYRMVRPWLIGPVWLRRVTVALGAGAVVGSMLIHADGVDFRALTPTWLAIALFVALPATFAVAVGVAVDRVEGTQSWTRRPRIRWLLPLVCIVLFPLSLFALAFSAVVLAVLVTIGAWHGGRDERDERSPAAAHPALVLTVRAAWLGIALLGLVALVNDIRQIAAVT